MAVPPRSWRALPWWSLGALPALLLSLGAPCSWDSSLTPRATRIVGPGGALTEPEISFARLAEGTPAERGLAIPAPLEIEVELAEPAVLSGITLQANHHDAFRITAAGAEGMGLGEVWTAPQLEPPGLRTRKSPRLDLPEPVSRLRVGSTRGRPFVVSDLQLRSPRVSIPAWCLAIAVWLAWVTLRGPSAAVWRTRWRRGDLRIALLLAGLTIPILSLPALAALAVDGCARLHLERRRPPEQRSWGSSGLLVLVAISALYVGLITHGGESLARGELLGATYDSLGDAFVDAGTRVAPWAIKWEGFEVEGGVTTYFGPLPALLRIPLNALAPTWYGRWSRVSCLIAALLAVWAALAIFHAQIERNPRLSPAGRRALLAGAVLGTGLATPLAFMLSAGSIYHEAPLWALAASLWGAHFALVLSREPARPGPALAALSLCAGAAFLSRVTFGLPLFAVLGMACLWRLLADRAPGSPSLARRLLELALLTSPASLLIGFQLWYNLDRFGSIFTFIDWQALGYLVEDEASWRILQQAGTFNPARIPGALWNYFALRPESLSSSLPFFSTIRSEHWRPELYPPIFVDYGISLLLASGWIVVAAALGCIVAVRRPTPPLARCLLVALAAQMLLVLSYYIVSHRYALDFLPFLLVAASFFAADFGRRAAPRRSGAVLGVAVAFAVVVTTLSTLSWISSDAQSAPRAYRQPVLDGFAVANQWLGLGDAPVE